jgi:hypothetical protein
MTSIFLDFKAGQTAGSGPQVAAALTPVAPPEDPYRLLSFYRTTNSAKVEPDIRYALLQDRKTGVKLPKQEGNAWVGVFTAFWTAAGELVKLQDSPSNGSWLNVFEAWKNVTNQLIRGYSTGNFEAWTVPCLYVVGKYLRAFAIKADAADSSEAGAFGSGFQDDVVSNVDKNAKLEEAARTINRMFTLCLSDR